jgi:hypothetical protein
MDNAQTLTCGPHETVRHYKDGMLKCAPAEKVVDCTERTNLRKWGTGDMFFTYATKICQQRTLVGGQSKESPEAAAERARAQYSQNSSSSSSSSDSRVLTLRGMTLSGGVGGQGFY